MEMMHCSVRLLLLGLLLGLEAPVMMRVSVTFVFFSCACYCDLAETETKSLLGNSQNYSYTKACLKHSQKLADSLL